MRILLAGKTQVVKLFLYLLFISLPLKMAAQTPELYVETRHSGNVINFAVSPDGKLFASGSFDKTIKLLDLASGREIKTLKNDYAGTLLLKFSPDSKILAIGNGNNILILNLINEKQVEIKTKYGINEIGFSPDSKSLISFGGDVVVREAKIFNVGDGTEILLQNNNGSFNFYSASWDFQILVTRGLNNKGLKLWDAVTRTELKRFKGLSEEDDFYPSLNGKMFVTSSIKGEDEIFTVWDFYRGEIKFQKKIMNKCCHWVKETPDSKYLFVYQLAGRGEAKLWNLTDGTEVTAKQFIKSANTNLTRNTKADYYERLSSNADLFNQWYKEKMANSVVRHLKIEQSPSVEYYALNNLLGISCQSCNYFKFIDVKTKKELKINIPDIPNSDISLETYKKYIPENDLLVLIYFSKDPFRESPNAMKVWKIQKKKDAIEARILNDKLYLKGLFTQLRSAAVSPDNQFLVSITSQKNIYIWNLRENFAIRKLEPLNFNPVSASFSPDSKILALKCDQIQGTVLLNVDSGKEVFLEGHNFDTSFEVASFRSDGRFLAGIQQSRYKQYGLPQPTQWSEEDIKKEVKGETIKLWDVTSGKKIAEFTGQIYSVDSIAFSADQKTLVVISDKYQNLVELWDISSHKFKKSLPKNSPDTKNEVSRLVSQLHKIDYSYEDVGVSKTFFAKPAENGKIALFSRSPEKELVSLFKSDTDSSWNDNWIVTDSHGRFDTDVSLEEISLLHWKLPGELLKPYPLEIFMRQYYEPGLLRRVLKCNEERDSYGKDTCDKEFKPLPSITEINRVQPKIEIKNIKINLRKVSDEKELLETVDVKVTVENATEKIAIGKESRVMSSGVYDLRLFRDGQLVGNSTPPDKLEIYNKIAPNLTLADESEKWRMANDLAQFKDATIDEKIKTDCVFKDGKATCVFRDIKLPRDGRNKIEFSAYAFNADRVKSNTARYTHEIKTPLPKREGRTYLVTIGVNASENPAYNLRYAAADARETQRIVGDRLKATNPNREIVRIPLVSDYDASGKIIENRTTKPIIKGVFDLLAGNGGAVPKEVLGEIEKIAQIPPVEPEDTLIIAYSGHGYADANGIFYLLPYGVGKEKLKFTPETLQKLISSDELSLWLRDVTAREMLMIVDACHSEAFKGTDFKPAPLGSRGLGQLAFDKGMKILSATQADNVALEANCLGQGLLTYALLQDGIILGKADTEKEFGQLTAAEWLNYAVGRVPEIHAQVLSGKCEDVKKGVEVECSGDDCRKRGEQKPKLFDFTRQEKSSALFVLAVKSDSNPAQAR